MMEQRCKRIESKHVDDVMDAARDEKLPSRCLLQPASSQEVGAAKPPLTSLKRSRHFTH